MTEDAKTRLRFQAGGTVRETSFYVVRKADTEFVEALAEGEFCYVLAPRQIGKSSLRLRAERRLEQMGIRCVNIDITDIGSDAQEETWYYSLAWMFAEGLGIYDILEGYWEGHKQLTPVHRFVNFVRVELLSRMKGRVVVFIDEIDVVLGLTFSADDFFASIREIYNDRAQDAACERLTFCLLGLAEPANLMKDTARTPFNVGRAIVLSDFTEEEAKVLLPGLASAGGDAEKLLNEVLGWTSGHPYMTQRICEVLVRREEVDVGSEQERVARVVGRVFLEQGRVDDANLHYADRYLAKENTSAPVSEMLFLYRRLLEGERIVAGSSSRVELHLCLAGSAAVRTEKGQDKKILVVRNRIFAEVFNLSWVKDKEAEMHFGEPLRRWLAAASERRDDFVLRGQTLQEALMWAQGRSDLTVQEEAFLRASQRAVGRERELQVRKVRLYMRILVGAVGGLILILALAIAQTIFAMQATEQARIAQQEAEQLRDAERCANAVTLAGQPGLELEALTAGVTVIGHRIKTDSVDAQVDEKVYQKPTPKCIEALSSALTAIRHMTTLQGHQDFVSAVSFTADGKIVATASWDKTARTWDAKTGHLLGRCEGHNGIIHALAFSPDGSLLATASEDRTVRLWEPKTCRSKQILQGHAGGVNRVIFSRDGQQILTASSDQTARLWSVSTGEPIARFHGHSGVVVDAALSQDSNHVLTGSRDNTARLWDAHDGKTISIWKHANVVNAVAFSPDGSRVLTASNDKTARFWNARDGKLIFTLEGHVDGISSIGFSPQGTQILTGSWDGTTRLWDANNGKPLRVFLGSTWGTSAFSPDGLSVMTGSADGTVHLWNMHDGSPIATFKGHAKQVSSVGFSPDGSEVLTGSWDTTARIWHAESGKPLRVIRAHEHGVRAVAYSPDGTRLATGGRDNLVKLWNATDGKLIKSLEGHTNTVAQVAFSQDGSRLATGSWDTTARLWDPRDGMLLATLSGHGGFINAIVFSPDSSLVATASQDKKARLWASQDGKQLATLDGHTGGISDITFSPNGLRIATASDDRTARLWSIKNGHPVATLTGHDEAVSTLAFSSDQEGLMLVTSSWDKTARLWNGKDGGEITILRGHTDRILDTDISPNNLWIATGSDDATARIWDLRNGQLRHELKGHTRPVVIVEFSPDGERLATASEDGTARLWDAEQGKLIATYIGHTGAIRSLAFSPNGRYLVTAGDEDGTLRIHAATASGFLIQACQLLSLQLHLTETEEICKTYLGQEP